MCWCTPSIKTPCCGKPQCVPVQNPIMISVKLDDLIKLHDIADSAITPSIKLDNTMSYSEIRDALMAKQIEGLTQIKKFLDKTIGEFYG